MLYLVCCGLFWPWPIKVFPLFSFSFFFFKPCLLASYTLATPTFFLHQVKEELMRAIRYKIHLLPRFAQFLGEQRKSCDLCSQPCKWRAAVPQSSSFPNPGWNISTKLFRSIPPASPHAKVLLLRR